MRRPLALVLAASLGSAAVLTAGVGAAAAPEPAVTVTFTATGLPLVACGSHPDVTGLSVPEDTPVLFVNATAGEATVLVADAPALARPVPAGDGALLTLAPGQHEIRLAPECGDAVPVVVTVSAAGPEPSADPTPTTSPAAAVPATGGPPALPSPPPPSASPAYLPAATLAAVPTAMPAAGRGSVAAAPRGLVAASPVSLEGGRNPKGVRVLAAIAVICVLGTTVAIIRSIVRLSP